MQPPKSLVNFGGEIAGLTLVVIPHNKAIESERAEEEWVPRSSAHSDDGSHLKPFCAHLSGLV